MREHTIAKYYIGICINGPKSKQRIEDNLIRSKNTTRTSSEPSVISRRAITTVETIIHSGEYGLCLFHIETGLTHQIRAQAAAAGFPLAGDTKYGGGTIGFKRYILHSLSMSLPDHDEICGFKSATAELPPQAFKKASDIFSKEEVNEALRTINFKILH
jgi:23S rRNA pseudouridine955/2504/2580 synthase